MDENVYAVGLPDGTSRILKYWFSGNSAMAECCNACIGYTIYDADTLAEMDGGEMDYDAGKKNYENLNDVLDDIVDFAFDGETPLVVTASGIDPDTLE